MTTNFLGLPIEGDIVRPTSAKPQRPMEEFAPILQAALDDPTIIEFGWRQYTPYFNDGDPCVFGAHGVWVRTSDDVDVEDLYDLEVDYNHPTLGKRPSTYNRETQEYETGDYEGPDEARYDRCQALHEAIDGGEFYAVLLQAFGDHAEVTVRRDGIKVDFYEHD
jgi:hypothetical protein